MNKNNLKSRIRIYLLNYEWKTFVKLIAFILLLFLLQLDQLTKFWARTQLPEELEKSFLPGFINLKFVINYGSAFGLNQNKTAILVATAFVIAVLLLFWWIISRSTINIIGITFILAGTIGNLIDRFLHNGGVVDFLKWDMFPPKTIFNVADMLVTLGVIIIVAHLVIDGIIMLVAEQKAKKEHQKRHGQPRKTS